MNGCVNRVFLIGNLGEEPKLRGENSTVLSLSVATSETWLDKDKVRKERTEWHRVVMFGGDVKDIARTLRKGSKVYIEGALLSRTYEKDGQKVPITEIVADRILGA